MTSSDECQLATPTIKKMYRQSYYDLSIKTQTEQSPAQGVDVFATTGELLTRKGKFLAVPLNGREQETYWSRDCAVKYMFKPGSRINVAIRACVPLFSYSQTVHKAK